ncbi:hypothetical protein JHK87_000950 [Glycine soja]|nr:hypothetical protein JHK87_000950 [Glycine soja]
MNLVTHVVSSDGLEKRTENKEDEKKVQEGGNKGELTEDEQKNEMDLGTCELERQLAVVNEDSTGDVIPLQHQIPLLKEELSILKRRQNISRSWSFSLSSIRDIKQSLELEDCCLENATDMVDQHEDNMLDYESKGIRMSHKQVYMGRLGYVNEGQWGMHREGRKQLQKLEENVSGNLWLGSRLQPLAEATSARRAVHGLWWRVQTMPTNMSRNTRDFYSGKSPTRLSSSRPCWFQLWQQTRAGTPERSMNRSVTSKAPSRRFVASRSLLQCLGRKLRGLENEKRRMMEELNSPLVDSSHLFDTLPSVPADPPRDLKVKRIWPPFMKGSSSYNKPWRRYLCSSSERGQIRNMAYVSPFLSHSRIVSRCFKFFIAAQREMRELAPQLLHQRHRLVAAIEAGGHGVEACPAADADHMSCKHPRLNN